MSEDESNSHRDDADEEGDEEGDGSDVVESEEDPIKRLIQDLEAERTKLVEQSWRMEKQLKFFKDLPAYKAPENVARMLTVAEVGVILDEVEEDKHVTRRTISSRMAALEGLPEGKPNSKQLGHVLGFLKTAGLYAPAEGKRPGSAASSAAKAEEEEEEEEEEGNGSDESAEPESVPKKREGSPRKATAKSAEPKGTKRERGADPAPSTNSSNNKNNNNNNNNPSTNDKNKKKKEKKESRSEKH